MHSAAQHNVTMLKSEALLYVVFDHDSHPLLTYCGKVTAGIQSACTGTCCHIIDICILILGRGLVAGNCGESEGKGRQTDIAPAASSPALKQFVNALTSQQKVSAVATDELASGLQRLTALSMLTLDRPQRRPQTDATPASGSLAAEAYTQRSAGSNAA